MSRHVCDCGEVYQSVDALHACANRNHGQERKDRICGQFFGPELRLPGMQPGTGMRKVCMRWENHKGDHSMENPELNAQMIENIHERFF